jgi:asparagine synthase (glutamine-hydrolysing)
MGGDELFWGYSWVREAVERNEAILEARKSGGGWWRRLLGAAPAQPDFFGVHADLRNGDAWSRALMPRAARERLAPGCWLAGNALDTSLPMHLAVTSLLNRTWLRSNCLALFDRMSMAHSVEARLPLLDVELVNLVVGMRNAGLEDWKKPHKWLLIEALRDALPADTLARKKQGFTPPIGDWMRGIIGRFGPLLADGALVRQGLVDPARVRDGASGFDRPFLYKLVLLECWTRMHVEGESAEALGAGAARGARQGLAA